MLRWIMLGTGALAAVLVVLSLLVDEGEVVLLVTHGAQQDGGERERHTTSLWIVEHDGARYLRSGSPDTSWLARLRADPHVAIEVHDGPVVHERSFTARVVEDAELRDVVAQAMAEKYGFADRLWHVVDDLSDSVVVELRPALHEAEIVSRERSAP